MTALTSGPFEGLQEHGYGTIVADPPWSFLTRSPKGDGRSANQHYRTMSLKEIKALPVADLAAKDCVLWMWAVDPLLDEGLEVIKSWGFTFKTVGIYWAKENRVSPGYHMGTGYWTRANPEQCLLATRGSPKRLDRGVRKLLVTKIREHSRKPDEVPNMVERIAAGPYLELFTRTQRDGWDHWGDQIGKFPTASAGHIVQAAE